MRLYYFIFPLLAFSFSTCSLKEDLQIVKKDNLINEDSHFEIIFTENHPVFSVSDVCWSEENYYLVSSRQNLVSMFSNSGEVQLYHSSTGRGPHDLAFPIKILCHNSSIFVLEVANTRIQQFDSALNFSNIINLPIMPFDFSVFENQIFMTGNDYRNGAYFSLHKIDENGTYLLSAFEDNDYSIYTYSQTNFHGIISAWHKYDNFVNLYDKKLNLIETITLPSDIFTSVYHPSVTPNGVDDSNIRDILNNFTYSAIEFASATPDYVLVHIRSINAPDQPDILAVYPFGGNEWFITNLENEEWFFQHHKEIIHSYRYDNDSEYGSLEVTNYKLNLFE
jgi:hypothetical protein